MAKPLDPVYATQERTLINCPQVGANSEQPHPRDSLEEAGSSAGLASPGNAGLPLQLFLFESTLLSTSLGLGARPAPAVTPEEARWPPRLLRRPSLPSSPGGATET